MKPHLLPACGLAIALLNCTSHAQITNLLSNGTFESGTLSGWTANGATASTNRAHSGSWAARCTSQSMRASVGTTPGVTYKLTGWVKIDSETGNTNGWGGARIEAYDTSGTSWQTLAHSGWLLTANRGTNWFKLGLTFTATAGATPIDVGYFGDNGRSMTVYFDDLMVFRKPASNAPPQLLATLSPTHLSGLPQTQNFSVTADDPDGSVRLVNWDFGDGAFSQAQSGARSINVPGQFIATARVVDDEGAVTAQQIAWSAQSTSSPTLTMLTPANGATISTALANVSGTASGSNLVVTVTGDRGETATLTGTSNWSGTIPLLPGWNRLLAQARDGAGRVTTLEHRVRFVPAGALAVAGFSPVTNVVQRWDVFEAAFAISNSAATHPQFPYETNLPAGLEWVDGISVEGQFTPDNWRTVYRRPAFLKQPFQRQLKSGEEWLYPGSNAPVWTVRFAPPLPGNWRYRVAVTKAKGSAVSAEQTFAVTLATHPLNHGPVRVAQFDSRYFEHEDGTFFPGTGRGIGASAESYSFDVENKFAAMGDANEQLLRFWIAGHIWGSAWQPWASATLGYNGTVPNTGLSFAAAYGDGLAAWQLDNANPMMWQGWNSGRAAVIPGRQYRIRARWRTEGIAAPVIAGRPYGVCVRWVGWPDVNQTTNYPLVLPHANGDTPWHVAEATFTASGNALQSGNYLANPLLVFENCANGRAFVDEVSVREVLGGGALGGELLRSPRANSHLSFDQRRGAGLDAILTAAAQHGKYFKLVISEKQEELLNAIGPGGLVDATDDHFFAAEGAGHRLHEYYWRHLIARFGAFRSVHSWETVNEQDPNALSQFQLTADLATTAHADGDPKLASTSTWASLATNTWKQPSLAAIDFADFHCYVRGTGWIEPKNELANDSARFMNEYDLAALAAQFGKPVVWGEQGIDGTGGTDGQEPLLTNDLAGVWLHKLIWARTGPGGVVPLYWYSDHIESKALHWRFGNWNRFMANLPMHNGRYTNAAATANDPNLRVLGQKDLTAGRAHLWLDNKRHTWRAVVAGSNIPPITASVQLPMQSSGGQFTATWFNTTNGLAFATQTLTADGIGVLTLGVTNLAADVAVQIAPASSTPAAPIFTEIRKLDAGTYLRWNAEPGASYQVEYRTNLVLGAWSTLAGSNTTSGLWGDAVDSAPADQRYYRLRLFP